MLVCARRVPRVSLLLPVLATWPAVHHYVKPAYWIGLPIVPVILLGYVFSGIYAVVTAGLYIERQTHVLAWIAGAGAVLNIAICIVAAPRWGMVGVAWATPAAYALDGGARRVAGQPRLSGAVRVAPTRSPRRHRRRALCRRSMLACTGSVRSRQPASRRRSALLAALPLLLLISGFFAHGEMRALRALYRDHEDTKTPRRKSSSGPRRSRDGVSLREPVASAGKNGAPLRPLRVRQCRLLRR